MATIGKKKFKEITQVSVIHEAIENAIGKEDSSFLENNPETWQREQKDMYDLLITHKQLILKKVIEILERKK